MSRIEELEKKLAADPNSRIFVQLAEEYRKQGLLDNAIEICEQGLTKHRQYPSARVALGRALLEAKTYDRACEEFESVLAQIPDNILANKFLGETYHRLGRYDEAIQKYQIAQTLSPEDMELEGKIEAVKAEMAAGGPAPERADETAPADPSEYGSQGASPPTPMGLSLGAPSPPPAAPELLEATLADGRVVTSDAPSPPPVPDDLAPPKELEPEQEEAVASQGEAATSQGEPAASQGEAAAPQAELAPIPLVDVDEPMVLEGASYRDASEPEPPPLEPVPIVSSMEAFEMAPPPPPPVLEPVDTAQPPPPLEPMASEPPPQPVSPPEEAFAPPPVDSPPPALEPPPMVPAAVELPPIEAAPIEAAPIEAAPIEAGVPAPDSIAGGDMETPTMAELYASQGHFDKAVLVYRNLIVRNPNETKYLERIEELEMLANASAEAATPTPGGHVPPLGDSVSEAGTRETIEVLEQWLEAVRRSRGA